MGYAHFVKQKEGAKGWFTSFLLASRCDQKCIWNDLDARRDTGIELFSIPTSRTRIQIISYALPVAMQRKQKDVNQA